MDTLTKFILRELAFEGDLGSDPSRLRDLITQYYVTRNPNIQQSVDDKLCSFVWSLLATQNNIIIGLAPAGAAAVYFPPQMSASRKGKEKDEDNIGASIELLPPDEFKSTRLETLVELYGGSLRIAVTPETCFECITGSHIRSPKLSGPVYAVLQLITRTRREGISVIDISKQSGYDPKTCFYLVQTLVNLGHIHKIKVGGAAGNICIHKDFYDDECEWKKAEKEVACGSKKGDSLRVASPAASDDEDDNAGKEFSGAVQFDSIDNRHISNVGVLKSRLQRLLTNMPHGIHVYRNLLFAIGFDASTKRERRTFNHRIHELIRAKFIEKVWAPSASRAGGRVLCVRLVQDNEDGTPMDVADPGAGDAVDDPTETGSLAESEDDDHEGSDEELLARFEGVCATQSVAHQIISAVERTGPAGVTIAEISRGINDFDPRSITGLVARFAGGVTPTHLADRGLVIMTETAGRERRQRVYTRAGYHSMNQREGFQNEPDDSSASMVANAGGWAVFEDEEFVPDATAREQWTAELAKAALAESGEKLLKARGKKKRTNPLDANGRPIIGRPRKEWKMNKDKDKGGSDEAPKKRGRPPKRKLEGVDGEAEKPDEPVAKRRGRPPKVKPVSIESESVIEAEQEPDTQGAPGEAQGESPTDHVPVQASMKDTTQAGQIERSEAQFDQSMAPVETAGDNDESPERSSSETFLHKRTRRSRRHKPSLDSESPARQPESPAKRSSARLRGRAIDSELTSIPQPPSKRVRVAPPERVMDNPERSNPGGHGIPESPDKPNLPTLVGLSRIEEPEEPEAPQPTTRSSPEQSVAATIVSTGGHPDAVQAEQPPAHTASRMGRPANVSALRRQTEFMQVIEKLGGVVNITNIKPFNDEHQRLLEQLHAEGKAVSTTPGTGMDRRTFSAAFSTLESRGLLKMRVVSTTTQAGTTRRATIAYIPSASERLINECVQRFQASVFSGKGVPISNDFPSLEGAVVRPGPRGTTHVVASNLPPSVQAPELSQDPLAIARYQQLSNPMTAAQYLGFISGPLARARALHLQLMSEVVSENPPRCIVSAEDWVISKTYFSDSIPVSVYCSVIKLGFAGPGLREMLDTEEGQRTRVHDAPADIQMSLGLRSVTTKSHLFKTLSILADLGCLIPIKPQILPNSQRATYLDFATEGAEWDQFKLAKSVPVYRFGDRDQDAPFCYDHAIHNLENATSFWEQLRVASDRSNCQEIPIGTGPQYAGNAKFTRLIRKKASWESGYILSSTQIEYLDSLIDLASGNTPLDDLQSTRFDNACFVTTAPVGVVSEYFTQRRNTILQEITRVRSEIQREAEEQRRIEEESRRALAAKAARAKMDQESHWETIISKALDGRAPSHPQLQKALTSLKSNFMISSRPANNKVWEVKVQDAVRDAIGAKQFVIPPRLPVQPFKPAQEPNNEVTELIRRQGQPIIQKDISPKKSGRKSKKQIEVDAEAETDEAQPNPKKMESDARRRRFPWNAEYDELARDAGAIIRVRCYGKRIDWSALEQVFPGVQRSCVRQRISSLESLPGASMYYRRLDAAWASVYQQHRGSNALPDPNPDSVKDFDLPAYITFLRKNVNKVALRAGAETTNVTTPEGSFVLESLDYLHANYIVNDKSSGQLHKQPTTWDFCFDVASEEPREREFLQHPFVIHEHDSRAHPPFKVSVAQASIKMVMSTPDPHYDSNHAATLLNFFGETTIAAAIEGLKDSLDMKKVRVEKQEPGRKYRYSDLETLRLKGEFASSMYPDAAAVRDSLECLQAEEWMSIGLTDEDGEAAAYLQLVSNNLIDINIDTEIPRAGRQHIGWQSKKVDDENLETQISMRLKSNYMSTTMIQNVPSSNQPSDLQHFLDQHVGASSSQRDHGDGHDESPSEGPLIDAIDSAGPPGLPVKQVIDVLNTSSPTALTALIKANPPQAYALGYDETRVVSAQYLSDWVVEVGLGNEEPSQTESKLIFPRRWLDIYGNMLDDIWTMAVRTMIGAFIYRPCMSERTLRSRFHGLFDRQELNDILTQLLLSGKLKRTSPSMLPIGMNTLEDEKATYWSLTNSAHWF
ncbi:unnamed protein product [Rhizoctonia solani]|uniref:Uncharacterized protein n=1 Tax=Rhizoctonia solani TaxID=456999 RepID=A0A8H3BWI4_9AGAM|nr:unnamed protein product [Rhizoctonia solani]